MLLAILEGAGFRCFRPDGAYYIMTDIRDFGFPDDYTFVRHMIEQAGVAAVPGSSFFANSNDGSKLIRFCFCKKYETLEEARNRLTRI
jgi:aminotransferase